MKLGTFYILYASKILTGLIKKMIEQKIYENLKCDQFGFRYNRGTREAIEHEGK